MVRLQFTHKGGEGSAKLHVPPPIARAIGREHVFHVEITDEGVLFRQVAGPVAWQDMAHAARVLGVGQAER
jgi:hypothetical protein